MSNNKQSSVEFYAKAEKDLSDRYSLRQVDYNQYREKKRELLEQAKAMHKEEIINSYIDGWHHNNEYKYNPIGYYTEQFGVK